MDLRYEAMVISGQPGSGASTVAQGVREVLQNEYGVEWEVGHFSEIWEKKKEEEAPEMSMDEYWANEVTREDNKEADLRMRDKIVNGEVQINDGRYIQPYLGLEYEDEDKLDSEDILMVQLTADLEERARRLYESDREDYQGLEYSDIKIKLLKRQLDELKEGARNYDRDHTNPEHYDMPDLDTTDMAPEEVVDEIVAEIVPGHENRS